jgi:hypothetical protein
MNDYNPDLNFDDESTGHVAGFVMPSSPADRKHIMDVMSEISASKTRSEAERDFQKEAIKELFDTYKIPKRLLNRFAKAYHKQSYTEELSVDSDFETLVEVLAKPSQP